ncbi:MAG: energy-coupling factor transporter transmembrane component T [Candidatus Scatomorpha sp.]|jgi:energy-coupling factor transporter transmembrane protein EcfT
MNIRSKLALGLSISTAIITPSFRQAWPILVLALSALPSLWMLLLKRWRMAGIYILILFFSYIDYFPVFDFLRLPWPILLFFTIVQYLLPGVAIGLLIMQTTSISEYLNGLKRMHIPAGFALSTSVIFRFIPTIRSENDGIKQALRMRGLSGLKALRHPLNYFNCRLVPLLLSAFRVADELSMASLCRGLSTTRERTSYEHDNLRFFDWIIISLSGLLILLWLFAITASSKI